MGLCFSFVERLRHVVCGDRGGSEHNFRPRVVSPGSPSARSTTRTVLPPLRRATRGAATISRADWSALEILRMPRAKKRKTQVRKGQVYQRVENPDQHLKVLEVHTDTHSMTALDQQGYRRLFPLDWMPRLRRVDYRDGEAVFAEVEPRKARRVVEHSTTPNTIDEDVPRSVDSLELARAEMARTNAAKVRVLTEKDRKGLSDVDEAEIASSSASSEILGDVYQVSPSYVRKLRRENAAPDRRGTSLTAKQKAELGPNLREHISGARWLREHVRAEVEKHENRGA